MHLLAGKFFVLQESAFFPTHRVVSPHSQTTSENRALMQGSTSGIGEQACVLDDSMQQTLALLAPCMDVRLFPKVCAFLAPASFPPISFAGVASAIVDLQS